MRLHRTAAILATAVLLLGGVTACTPSPIVALPTASHTQIAQLVVGTPAVPDGGNPLEGALLAHVYAAALNAAGLTATVSQEDPADPTSLDKLRTGAVDIVPGYSSTFLSGLNPANGATTSAQVLQALASSLPAGVSMLDAAKAEDNDGLAVTAVTAQKYNLKSIGDLAKVCDKLTFGGSEQFRAKDHGLSTLGSDYNCVPNSYQVLPSTKGELLLALLRDDIQVADIHSSSPAIYNNSLVVLTDTKQVFRPQTIVPLASTKKVPADVQSVLNKVTGVLSNDALVNLNSLATGTSSASLDAAAHAWLVLMGLLKATS